MNLSTGILLEVPANEPLLLLKSYFIKVTSVSRATMFKIGLVANACSFFFQNDFLKCTEDIFNRSTTVLIR